MQIFLTTLFILAVIITSLAMTNFFENITKETLTEPAEVRSSCENIQKNGCGCNGAPLETRDYYITFFLPLSGKKLKCRVSQKKLSNYKVGMIGNLTHKGSWFKGFTEESQEFTLVK